MHDRPWPALRAGLVVEAADAEDVVDVTVAEHRGPQRCFRPPPPYPLVQQSTEQRVTGVDQQQPVAGVDGRDVGESVPERDAVRDVGQLAGTAAERMVRVDR